MDLGDPRGSSAAVQGVVAALDELERFQSSEAALQTAHYLTVIRHGPLGCSCRLLICGCESSSTLMLPHDVDAIHKEEKGNIAWHGPVTRSGVCQIHFLGWWQRCFDRYNTLLQAIRDMDFPVKYCFWRGFLGRDCIEIAYLSVAQHAVLTILRIYKRLLVHETKRDRGHLAHLLRLADVREEVQVTVAALSDFAYGWAALNAYAPRIQMQARAP